MGDLEQPDVQLSSVVPSTSGGMQALLLYVVAVLMFILLYWFYKPQPDTAAPSTRGGKASLNRRRPVDKKQKRSLFAVLGISQEDLKHFEAFRDKFSHFDDVTDSIKRAGLETCGLIIGVDFTASNEWQGRKTFRGRNLHTVSGNKINNPYQKVISILGQILEPFSDDKLIPAYGFGDSATQDHNIFPLRADDQPCVGFEDVLQCYNNVARKVTLSGPTNFAPIINEAIHIAKHSKKYFILVIIADGQVTEEQLTIDAIVEASKYPISIIVVGVGDGPWEAMDEFDNHIPRRKFDNFQFVNYHQVISKAKFPDAAFALQALMEIPDQYKTIKYLGYIGDETSKGHKTEEKPKGD
ncbi:E3 ubiquitin-protein ligase RGLG4 [Lingula anatina]|uniref:E3 ubiquitin-protein ligase RGLG4 n=1 Tax=Lingula anatina TaxID=7574 RepID=A0A1S3J1P4_LINAN|nr:E3 ubiquitin-protein ligase RGLG4 [Lingula anatina]|eukprot:XP_013403744.1 E3 ubiquitin-protein ligase RGLG4 [Lingula anatina]